MAFGNFTHIAQVQTAYQIQYERKRGLVQPQPYTPSAGFVQLFTPLSRLIDIYASEEMRKHAVIFPMLADVYQHYAEHLVLWSEEYIAVPDDAQLNGYPDFLVTQRSPLGYTVMADPFLIVVEAKEDDFTKGWGQCLAGMVAAQRLNHDAALAVYGIVTNGQTWQWGRLQGNHFEQEDASVDRVDAFDYLNAVFAAVAQTTNQ
ncbi:MAG: hypothetical protein U0350_04865 [Caldilineaceae bacterium]